MAAKKKHQVLRIRKLADRRDGERIVRYHPETGERMLVRPETVQAEGFDYAQMTPEPWPLAGVRVEGDVPDVTTISTGVVTRAAAEGWLTVENERVEHRPGGPPSDPWRVTHTFRHADALVLHTVDGDIRYRVTRQPDKYNEPEPLAGKQRDGEAPTGTRVDWFYRLERDHG
jgi:hypothetical protein